MTCCITTWGKRGYHIAGARHVRLDRLPERLASLDLRGTAAVICGGGHRSSVAASLLQQHGFNVRNLSGGFVSYALSFEAVSERASISTRV